MYNYEAATSNWNCYPDRVNQNNIFDICLSNDAMKVGYALFDPNVATAGARLYEINDNTNAVILPPKYNDMESTSISISSNGAVFAVSDNDFVCNNGNTFCGRVRVFNATNNGPIDIVNDQIGGDILGSDVYDDYCGSSIDLSNDGKVVVIACNTT